jgi:hypothetical protein
MEVYSCTDSTKSSVADPEPDPDPQGSETFGQIRIRSGTEINISDPDSNPDSKSGSQTGSNKNL